MRKNKKLNDQSSLGGFAAIVVILTLAAILAWSLGVRGDALGKAIEIFKDGRLTDGASKAIDLLKSRHEQFNALAGLSILGIGYFLRTHWNQKLVIPKIQIWVVIFAVSFSSASILLGFLATLSLENVLFQVGKLTPEYQKLSISQGVSCVFGVILLALLLIEPYMTKRVAPDSIA